MRTKTLAIIVILSLSILLALPAPYLLRVNAVTQSGATSPFSAFGPRANEIIFKVYADESAMLADYDSGLVDVVDVPDNVNRLDCASNPAITPLGDSTPNGCDQNNANYYVTNPQADLGEFQIDISHLPTWLGKSFLCARTTVSASCSPQYAPGTPAITIITDNTDDACAPTTQFRLVVHLRNYEENLAPITDASEVVSATPPAGTGSSLSSTTGTYDLGCLSGTPSKYVVSTFLFGTTSNDVAKIDVFTSSGVGSPQCLNTFKCDVNFDVNYRSPSTKKLSLDGINIIRAMQYLTDKPNFRNINQLKGAAACIDVHSSPAQNIMNSVGDPTTACSFTNGGVPSAEVDAATIAADCAVLSSASGPTGWSQISPCTAASLYNLSSDDIAAGTSCATNSLGSQIPTATCFPSRGNQGPATILAEHGYSGPTDLTAACDHLLLAGFTISAGATCADVAAGNVVSGVTAHLNNGGQQISFYVRLPGAFPPRPRYGQIAADELDFMFGTPAPTGGTICYGGLLPTPGPGATCSAAGNVQYYSIGQVGGIVFTAQNTWNMYTGGQSHGSTPDALIFSYHSQFASDTCGGVFADFPDDYDSFCDPIFDTYDWAGEFSAPTFSASFTFFQKALTLFATRGATAPQYAQVNKFIALNDWNFEAPGPGGSSLVSAVGHGFEAGTTGAFWSLLNMRNGPAGVSPYLAGGGVDGRIRRASSGGGLLHQNVLASANTVWEVDPLNLIWDTMLAANPNSAGSTLQLINWMTTSHTAFFDSATGQNTQTFNLRKDLCFQDSTTFSLGSIPPCDRPVTADDVCFSIAMERDGPGLGKLAVQDVISCTYPDMFTVVVKHQGLSTFQPLNVGGVPILPAHLWGQACNWATGPHSFTNTQGNPGSPPAAIVAAPCVDQSFDPMALTYLGNPFPMTLPANVNGLMVGSGPMMCVVPPGFGSLSGKIGGSCALNSLGDTLIGQNLTPGNTERLIRFPFYMRCCGDTEGSNLQALSWADVNDDGKVTIVDASSLSAVFGLADPYFDDKLFDPTDSIPGTVRIGEASFLASYYDSGTIAPCINQFCPGAYPEELTPAGPLIGPDTALDPWRITVGAGQFYVKSAEPQVIYIAGPALPAGAITFVAVPLIPPCPAGTPVSNAVSPALPAAPPVAVAIFPYVPAPAGGACRYTVTATITVGAVTVVVVWFNVKLA